jgi:iron complex transport system ATP-binding protein
LKFGVHIISGGGTGSYLMKALLEKGFQISAGVLSTLDTDYETARTFDVCVVPEIPFTMISENAYRLNIDFIKKSDAVIVTEFPVGEANLDNLRAAEEALSVGKKVIVISSISADKKDFAFGKAQDCFARLKQNGACFVRTVEDALEVINKLYSHRSHKNHKN